MTVLNLIQAAMSWLPQKSHQQKNSLLQEHEIRKFCNLGFNESICQSHPQCVRFLLDSGLAFQIAMFKHTTEEGIFEHDIRLDNDNHPLIKMNGKWERWEEIHKLIEFDKIQEKLIAKGQPAIGYNYISPEGLVQKEYRDYVELYPLEVLSKTCHEVLKKHAEKFWQTNEEIDPGEEKDCVLQVVTTKRTPFKKNWLTENIIEKCPEHVFTRLIDKTGKVYSFGVKNTSEDNFRIFGFLPWTIGTTVPTNITTPDYEESRKFDERRVTSIPLTTKRKDEILRYVNETNSDEPRFNYARQNCSKFSQVVLEKAGIFVNTRSTFVDFIGRMLPSPTRIPIIGSAIKAVSNSVESCANTIYKISPKPLQKAFSLIGEGNRFVKHKIDVIFSNTVVLCVGGLKMSKPLKNGKVHESKIDDHRMTNFHRLIHSPSDLFNEELSDLYNSHLMIEWQMKQESTHIHTFDKSRMYIVPENSAIVYT